MSEHTPRPPEYVSTTRAAQLAGVPPRTVRHWAMRGKVEVQETLAGRVVRLSDVQALAAAMRFASGEAKAWPEAAPGMQEGKDGQPVLEGEYEASSAAPSPQVAGNLNVLAALLAAHAETVAAKDQTIAAKDETIAALRRQLEASHRLWQSDPAPTVEPRRPWWRWW